MSITLTDDQTNELIEEMERLLFRLNPNPNSSDYECSFCCKRPTNARADIEHAPDCSGKKFLSWLRSALDKNLRL